MAPPRTRAVRRPGLRRRRAPQAAAAGTWPRRSPERGRGRVPDIDEPGSTIARTFGFLTGSFAWIAHKISGGHRKGTHSLLALSRPG